MLFKEFDLSSQILRSLEEQKYEEASPIQELAIPAILAGNDILGCAQTGTGKTCAFVAPMIQKIFEQPSSKKIKGLIISPTRELAIQIYENAKIYGKYTNIKVAAIYGGISEQNQKRELSQGVDILVATPGRLLDFINQKVVNISAIDYFVLDEADRMLDMGFINDIKKIIKYIPSKRQTLLFSATIPDTIKVLCNQLLNNPIHINVTPPTPTVEKVVQKLYYVDKNNKTNLLIDIIKNNSIPSALVFSRTKHGADRIQKFLMRAGISSAAIHGNKSQTARQNALNSFKDNKIKVLVATDIAARGIDVDNLSHVFNYDLPDTAETYVHRIGRTARAGKAGEAIAFCCIDECDMIKEIETACKVKLEKMDSRDFEMKVFTKTEKKQPTKRRVR